MGSMSKVGNESIIEEAVSWVKCYCCGLTEECTGAYIDGVRERYQGRWICGLCAEAVKEHTDITTGEALKQHMSFCQNFRSLSSTSPRKHTHDLILAMKHLLFRALDSPPSPSPSPRLTAKDPLTCRPLATSHSQSCFSTHPEPPATIDLQDTD